jgi:hypothetical protein
VGREGAIRRVMCHGSWGRQNDEDDGGECRQDRQRQALTCERSSGRSAAVDTGSASRTPGSGMKTSAKLRKSRHDWCATSSGANSRARVRAGELQSRPGRFRTKSSPHGSNLPAATDSWIHLPGEWTVLTRDGSSSRPPRVRGRCCCCWRW